MSRARDFADLAGAADAGGITGKNLIVNGAMQVAQRGTSSTGITSASYPTCDRWYFNINSAGTWTVSQSTDAPAGSGFTNSFKADCTTADSSLAAGDYIQFQQRFEGQNLQQLKYGTSSAEKITLSFWVKATKTGTNVVMLYQDDAGDMINAQYTINASNTWEYKTLTFVGNTGDVITNDNTRGFICIWHLAAGSSRTSGSIMNTWGSYTTANEAVGQVNHADSTSNNWQITGVQLEIGEQATPFEHRSFGDELAMCQRYYYQTPDSEHSVHTVRSYNNGNQYYGPVVYPVTMRANPTFSTQTNTINLPSISNTTGTFTAHNITRHRCIIRIVPASDAGTYTYTVIAINNAMKFDAEL
jgi:hypothetical protein